MSSYINFYLVPKKSKKIYGYDEEKGNIETEVKLSEGVPLLLSSWSRNNEVYQAYDDTLNPPYAGRELTYKEISHEDAKRVVQEFEEDLKKTEKRLEIDYKMLKEGGYSEEIWEDIHSMEEYVTEQKNTLQELNSIADIVYDVTQGYTDFEKVLINIV